MLGPSRTPVPNTHEDILGVVGTGEWKGRDLKKKDKPVTHKHEITPSNIMPMAAYAPIRKEKRRQIIELKRHRRMAVGPDVMFYFENYDTMWNQVHEMLYAEGGGAAQIADELAAFNPLIPKGAELVATMMIEIADEKRRAAVLGQLGGIENTVTLTVGDHVIAGAPERDVERTSAGGKTSSVHFLHFAFPSAAIQDFRAGRAQALLAINIEGYQHMAMMPEDVRKALAQDFD